MTDNEPTIRDVLDAMQAMEGRLEGRLTSEISGLEGRLDAKIEGVEGRLTNQLRSTEDNLKAEIAGAYDLHHNRIKDLERRVLALEEAAD